MNIKFNDCKRRMLLLNGVATLLLCLLIPFNAVGMEFIEAIKDGDGTIEGMSGAKSVAISPDGNNVYVASEGSDAVAVFSRNITTGALIFMEAQTENINGVDGMYNPQFVTVSPDNKNVYVVSDGFQLNSGDTSNQAAIAVFRRDINSGKLIFVEHKKEEMDGIEGLNTPGAVIVSHDEKHVYVVSNGSNILLFNRNIDTGELMFVERKQYGENAIKNLNYTQDIAISFDNKYVYVANSLDDTLAVFSRDINTGKLTFIEVQKDGIDGVDGLNGVSAITVSPNDKYIYAAGKSDDSVAVFKRDTETGKLTLFDIDDEISNASSVAISPDNNYVYVTGKYGIVVVFKHDTNTDKLTFVEFQKNDRRSVTGLNGALSIVVSPDARHVYIVGENDNALVVFNRDIPTGKLTFLEKQQQGTASYIFTRAQAIIGSYDNQYIYVATRKKILVFYRDTGTGELTLVEIQQNEIDGVEILNDFTGITIEPKNKYLYAVGSHGIVVFNRNIDTGKLTFVEIQTEGVNGVEGLYGANSVAVNPNNEHVYVVSEGEESGGIMTVPGAIAVFKRDENTGTLTFIETIKQGVDVVTGLVDAESVMVSLDNHYVYVTSNPPDDSLLVFKRNTDKLDPNFGKLTFVETHEGEVGSIKNLKWVRSLTISPDNKHVYLVSVEGLILAFSRKIDTGELTFVEVQMDDVDGVTQLRGARSIMVSSDNNYVYVTASVDNTLLVFRRDPNTGELYIKDFKENGMKDGIKVVSGMQRPVSVFISPDNQNVYVASDEDNGAVAVFTTIINEAPKNKIPTIDQTTDEDTPLIFPAINGNAISTSDKDVYNNLLKITLIADNGTITLNGTNDLTFLSGADGAAEMTFTGKIIDINTALKGMKFTPRDGFNGATTLKITTDDQGNTGGGGAKSDTDIINITVKPIIKKPSVSNAATEKDKQTTNGLVISRNKGDGVEVSHFQITNITGGKLYHNDGIAPINNGDFIEFFQGDSGLRFTPNSSTPGSFNVQSAMLCDNEICPSGEVETANIAVNTSPVLAEIGEQKVNVNETLSFTAKVITNTENNSLSFRLEGAPNGATINPNTGKFVWTPTGSGTYSVTVTIMEIDGNPSNLTDSETVPITVTALPVLKPIGDYSSVFGEKLNFEAIGTHPENFPLQYSLINAPPGVNIDPITGTFTWAPTRAGIYNTIVRVTETHDNSYVEEAITITVNQAKTGLRLELDSPSIFKNSGVVNIFGKLTSYPDIGQNLQSLDIKLEIISPDGEFFRTETIKTYSESGEFRLENLTGFAQEGVYTIRAMFNGTENLAAPNPNFLPTEYLQVSGLAGHAIIIQGRLKDDKDGEKAHNKSLNRVYWHLKARSFVDDNIEYLNYNHGSNDPSKTDIFIDGIPSKAEITNAFARTQARMNANPGPLYIVMVDHGGVDGSFYLDEEIISPNDLDILLENLETGLTPLALEKERVAIIGACYSGSYIPTVSKSGRTIVTSTTETEESYKGPTEPDKIRSGEFFIEALFSELGKGKSLQQAFNIATESIETFTRIGGDASFNLRFQDWAAQHPLLDDNGDGNGSNILSTIWEPNQEGSKAKITYLGLGKRFRADAPENPAEIIEVTPTRYLNAEQTSVSLLAMVNNPGRVAGKEVIVDIRAPSVTLSSDGIEHKGQLEIDGLRREQLILGEGHKFTGNFAGFTEPGKYEIFYFVQDIVPGEDIETGDVSPLKRSLVFKDSGHHNAPPYPFDLQYPDDGAETPTVVIFDWDKTFEPDNDNITYTLILASDPHFSDEVYRQEGLTLSMGYVDNNTVINDGAAGKRAGLRDGTEYFWKVEAVDSFGKVTRSTSTFAFTTNNKNQPPNINSVSIISDFDSPLARPRKTEPDKALVDACDDLLCYYFLTDGREKINIPALELTIPPNYGLETANHHGRRRGNIPSNPGQLQFAVGSAQVDEKQGKVGFIIERVGGSDGEVSVSYATLDKTATKGTDYNFANDIGVLTWADKETHSQRLTLNLTDDQYFEGDEIFTVILLNTSGENSLGANSQVTVTIVDDEIAGKNPPQPSSSESPPSVESEVPSKTSSEPPPSCEPTNSGGNIVQVSPPMTPPIAICNDDNPVSIVQFSELIYTVQENQSSVKITVTRENGEHGAVSVKYATTAKTATAEDDYTQVQGEFSWEKGDTSPKTFTVPIINDDNKERDEIIGLELLDHHNNVINIGRTQAIINILDDDFGDENSPETNSQVPVAIVGDEPKDNIINGSGDNPSSTGDSKSESPTIVAEPPSSSKPPPNCKSTNDGNDVQPVLPTTPTCVCNCDNQPVSTNVCKDDNPPAVQFSDIIYRVQENKGYVEITVTRDNGSHGKISVRYQTSDNTALANNDYRNTQSTLTWFDGEDKPKTFNVPIINDDYKEGDEIIRLELLDSHGNAITRGRTQAIINILDDDNLNDDTPVAPEELPLSDDDSEDDEIEQCVMPPQLPSCTVTEEDGRTFIAFEHHTGNQIDISYVSNDPDATFTISSSEGLPNLVLPSLGKGTIIDNGEFLDSNAKFAGGIAVDGDDYEVDVTMSVSKPVVITGKISPLPYHIDETVDILVVAGYKPHDIEAVETFYMLNTGRIPLLWDVNDIDALLPFVKEVTLKSNHRVDIFSGDFPGTAELRIFFGYRLADGKIVFNGKQTIDAIVNE